MNRAITLIIGIFISQIGFSQINHEEDKREFLESIELFMKANEIESQMFELFQEGKIPEMHPYVKTVTEGISLSEKVSHSFLDSKHPELLKKYHGFVNSHKQLLHIYDEVRDPNEAIKIQKEVSEKRFNFLNFLKDNQDLFSDEFRIVQEDEQSPKKKGGVKDFLWFLGKAWLALFPFIFALAIISLFFNGIAFGVNNINKGVLMIYLTVVSIIYLYFYGFLGAYYRELYEYYSTFFNKNWILYIVCLIAIFSNFRHLNNELIIARQKLNQSHPLGVESMKLGTKFSNDDIVLISTIHNFRGAWMILVAFILFSFSPNWITKIYGDFPNYLATLFN